MSKNDVLITLIKEVVKNEVKRQVKEEVAKLIKSGAVSLNTDKKSASLMELTTPIKTEKLVKDSIQSKNNKEKAPFQGQRASSMACVDIKRAKTCKTNPKCFYDYIDFMANAYVITQIHNYDIHQKNIYSLGTEKIIQYAYFIKFFNKLFILSLPTSVFFMYSFITIIFINFPIHIIWDVYDYQFCIWFVCFFS